MHPARAYLRQATRDAHARVDQTFDALDLARPAPYAAFLAAHRHALSDLGPMLGAGLVDPHCLTACLDADLAALNRSMDWPDVPMGPFSGDPLGIAYVLAGSHFGASVVMAKCRVGGSPAVVENLRYLGSPHLKEAWSGVMSRLVSYDNRALNDVACAALWTFDVFDRHGQAARDVLLRAQAAPAL